MSIDSLYRVAFVATCVASIHAQGPTVVSPIEWASVDAPSSNGFPFGSSSVPYRYLQIHDDLTGQAGTIRGLALRRSGTTSTTVIAAFDVVLDAWVSTAATTGSTVDPQFDVNHGADKAQVVFGRTISFPAAPTGLLPYPFRYQIPFDVPFVFAGTGPLCWEVQITARVNQPSALFHDYVAGPSSNPSMVVSRYGDGCIATGETLPYTLTGGSSNSWSSGMVTLTATCSNGIPGGTAVLFVGVDPALAISIPLPGTDLAPSGTCFLQTAPVAQVPGTLSTSGGLTFRLAAAATPALQGLRLFSQAFVIDLPANPWGVVGSNAVNHQVLAPYAGGTPGGRVYRAASLAASGTAGANQMLVVEFAY